MANNSKNKYPADKAGTQFDGFRNTKRTPPAKARVEPVSKESGGGAEQKTANKTA
jgi:hypothetical protein